MKSYFNFLWVFIFLLYPLISHCQNTNKTGCISGNCVTGWGTYVDLNGKYVGYWKDSKQEGYGTYTWTNGDKYEGQWLAGKMSGTGTYIWTDGTKLEVYREHDSQYGSGVLIDKAGRLVKQDNLNNNKYYRKLYGRVMPSKLFISNRGKINILINGNLDTAKVNTEGDFVIEFSENIKNPVLEFSGPVIFSKSFEIGKVTNMTVCLNPRYRKGTLAAPLFGPVFYSRSINKPYISAASFTDVFGIMALTFGMISHGDYNHNQMNYNAEYERHLTLSNINEIAESDIKMAKLFQDKGKSWNNYISGTVTGCAMLAASLVIRVIAITQPNVIKIKNKNTAMQITPSNRNVTITPVSFTQNNIQNIGVSVHF